MTTESTERELDDAAARDEAAEEDEAGRDEAAEDAEPTKGPSARPASGKGAAAKAGRPAVRRPIAPGTNLRSKLMLGADSRTPKRQGGSSGAKTALIALSLLLNVIALSVCGWFLYAHSLPGKNGSVAGLKLADVGSKVRTKEEETARAYVSKMMNFDFQHLDAFNAAMSTGISGDLKKTTGPQQLDAIKQLFNTLEVRSSFKIVASEVIEENPDQAVVAVAGHQTLDLKGDKGPRSMSTIIKATVQKKDQSISSLDSLDDMRNNPEDKQAPLFPVPHGGQADGTGQGSQQPKAPKPGQSAPAGQ